MIDRDYCVMIARYNEWQNKQLIGFLKVSDSAGLTRDRGAFFGSILGTLNHLLWGDHIWMSRFDGGSAPEGGIPHGSFLHTGFADWRAARRSMDQRITDWAGSVSTAALRGDPTWYSGAAGRELSKPLGLCVVHFFNHQTHHRGQVHAMLTATGSKAPVSDLVFMSEDAA